MREIFQKGTEVNMQPIERQSAFASDEEARLRLRRVLKILTVARGIPEGRECETQCLQSLRLL